MRLLMRLRALFHKPDARERAAQERYRASLEKAVNVMPGDRKLRELLNDADRALRAQPR